jgi:hypothetical protein
MMRKVAASEALEGRRSGVRGARPRVVLQGSALSRKVGPLRAGFLATAHPGGIDEEGGPPRRRAPTRGAAQLPSGGQRVTVQETQGLNAVEKSAVRPTVARQR